MADPLYRRKNDTLFTSVGDDIVALSVERGQCYGMEKVAATVWNLLEHPISIDQLSARVSEAYEVEPEQCRPDIERLIDQLKSEDLVAEVAA